VPQEVYETIFTQAKRERIAMWKVIQRAWAYHVSTVKSFHQKSEPVDKIAWYAYKLSASVGEFRGNPTPENFARLEENVRELKERMRIDAQKVLLAATQYMRTKKNKDRMLLNDSAKEVIVQLISTLQKR